MLIAPGAIAYLVTRTFGHMLAVAVIVAVAASFCGVILLLHRQRHRHPPSSSDDGDIPARLAYSTWKWHARSAADKRE